MSDEGEEAPPFTMSRRAFGQSALAALAGAALPGCADSPPELIVPYVDRPAGLIPGRPSFYATSVPRDGYGLGLVARSREGRPVKLEGNAEHPQSLGGTSAAEQALLYELYDDGRLRGAQGPGGATGFGTLARLLRAERWEEEGEGLAFLLEPTTAPTVLALVARLAAERGAARVAFGPSPAAHRLEASRRVFGEAYELRRALDTAAIVVSVGGDPLVEGPDALRYARALGARRGEEKGGPRLYALETPLSLMGAYADARLPLAPSALARAPAELFATLGRRGLALPEAVRGALRAFDDVPEPRRRFLDVLATDVMAQRGRVALFVGEGQSVASQVVGLGLESLLGASVRRAFPTPLVGWQGGDALREALEAGAIHTLIVEGNPLLGEPKGGAWERALSRPQQRVVLTDYPDESAQIATWRVGRAHPLERWGALRGPDGTLGTTQPLITPLFAGRTIEALLSVFVKDRRGERSRLVEALAAEGVTGDAVDAVLERGLVPGSAREPVEVEPAWPAVAAALEALAAGTRPAPLELSFVVDPRVGGGETANNAWLRELPDPITHLSWENAALVGAETAARLEVATGDVVRLELGAASLELPAFVQPGQAEGTVVLWPGYGRGAGGPLATLGGHDVRGLRAAHAAGGALSVRPVGRTHVLALAQVVSSQLDEEVARRRNVGQPPRPREGTPPSLHPEREGSPHQWGMVIDLAACTGCSACVVACQAENNIPSVGRVQVSLGRAMHWLRIDRYYETHAEGTRVTMQPMACQHCEKAPCEYVCPTAATSHSADGLNQMVYNRCVGTRFCSNNCPYKVRRFNFFDYQRDATARDALRMNPEVTVRARGVMEKCTYCVQRLRAAERDARRERRGLHDGEARTACQQACPSGAIVFGRISDEDSEVSRWRRSPRAYAALGELGVQPRTLYLERLDRPPPEGRR